MRLAEDGTPLPVPVTVPQGPAPREDATVQRIVRNTSVSLRVKKFHRYVCQVCGERIPIASGFYAEGAHIRPLGRPHDGPDVEGNVLCLCPNDHVRFELGSLVVQDDLTIVDRMTGQTISSLRTVARHKIDGAQLVYHRERFDLTV